MAFLGMNTALMWNGIIRTDRCVILGCPITNEGHSMSQIMQMQTGHISYNLLYRNAVVIILCHALGAPTIYHTHHPPGRPRRSSRLASDVADPLLIRGVGQGFSNLFCERCTSHPRLLREVQKSDMGYCAEMAHPSAAPRALSQAPFSIEWFHAISHGSDCWKCLQSDCKY